MIVVEAKPCSLKTMKDDANDSNLNRNSRDDGSDIELDHVPAPLVFIREVVLAEQVTTANAAMEDPHDRQHLMDEDYPDVDSDDKVDLVDVVYGPMVP